MEAQFEQYKKTWDSENTTHVQVGGVDEVNDTNEGNVPGAINIYGTPLEVNAPGNPGLCYNQKRIEIGPNAPNDCAAHEKGGGGVGERRGHFAAERVAAFHNVGQVLQSAFEDAGGGVSRIRMRSRRRKLSRRLREPGRCCGSRGSSGMSRARSGHPARITESRPVPTWVGTPVDTKRC